MLYAHFTHIRNANARIYAPPAGWDAADWQAFFDERAGIYEFDAGRPRDEAEAAAWESCRLLAFVYVARLSPLQGKPTPQELVAITIGRIRAADDLLAQAFGAWRAAA